MQHHPDWTLTIEGHTDSIGGAEYNKDLSDRRAAAVKAELTAKYGVPAARLATKGYGLSRPVDKNSTIEGRARNRRVELTRVCGKYRGRAGAQEAAEQGKSAEPSTSPTKRRSACAKTCCCSRPWQRSPAAAVIRSPAANADQASDKKEAADQVRQGHGQGAGGMLGGIMKMAAAQDSIDKANPYHELDDPCILVSRAEVEKYLGPLRADPWREDTKCVYDAASGRSVRIDVSYSGGKMAMKMMKAVGGLTTSPSWTRAARPTPSTATGTRCAGSTARSPRSRATSWSRWTSRRRTSGRWARPTWPTSRSSGSRSPLHYDSGNAHKPGPLVQPRDPCSLVTRDEATAILGKLVGDPKGDEHSCTFTVPSPLREGTTMPVELTVQWTGGFYDFGQEKEANGLAQKSFIGPLMDGSGVGQMEEKAKTDTQAKADLERMRATMKNMGGPAMKDGKPRVQERHQRRRGTVGRGGGADRVYVRGGEEGRLHEDGPAAAGRGQGQGAGGEGDEPNLTAPVSADRAGPCCRSSRATARGSAPDTLSRSPAPPGSGRARQASGRTPGGSARHRRRRWRSPSR